MLMADAVNGAMPRPAFGRRRLAARLRVVAEANLALHVDHPWLVDVADNAVSWSGDDRQVRPPAGRLDRDGLDVEADAALTFVLDFARARMRWTRRADERAAEAGRQWAPVGPVWRPTSATITRRRSAWGLRQPARPRTRPWRIMRGRSGLDRVVAAIEDLVRSSCPRPR
ncbi:MAG: hypothetical protein U0R65_02240 [Candidatus Nanopelagicales bacterium]